MSIHLTPAKAAILLGTSDRTVRSLIQQGVLPATAVGRRMGGRKGPVRYEIALEDLPASGLPVDLARLPLLVPLRREANAPEEEQPPQQAETTLLQRLQDEYAPACTPRGTGADARGVERALCAPGCLGSALLALYLAHPSRNPATRGSFPRCFERSPSAG